MSAGAARYRDDLPQLRGDGVFLTDGGLETSLIFQREIDLPAFAAFDLLKDEKGTDELRRYFDAYVALAVDNGLGFVLESPTWRASPRWAEEIGYTPEQLDRMNRDAIFLMEEIRDERESERTPIVISGCIGPQDDGYNPKAMMTADAAAEYHATQIGSFADTAADMVTAMTLTYIDEAVGVVEAAKRFGLPVAISFTVETDGELPDGQPLGEAIAETDERTGGAPAYYMINCAHPTHFEGALDEGEPWRERVRALRANASTKSHAELDEATVLDDGDPADLGARYVAVRERLPRLNVLGGCCGTDERHVAEIRNAWLSSSG